MANPKEPFIPKSDRPKVDIAPETPVSELTVRDLHSILAQPQLFKVHKDKEFYKEGFKEYFKEIAKDFKEFAFEKQFIETVNQLPQEGDPGQRGLSQLIEHVGGLHRKIDELTSQVAQLKSQK